MSDTPKARLARARLYLVTEARPGGRDARELVAEALAGGVDAVQLRDRSLSDAELVGAGRWLCALCHEGGALFVVNDRPDLALDCDADGVHLGQEDMPVGEAREMLGEGRLIGVSTHSPDQLAAAEREGADYAGVGPVFATPTKPGAPPVGPELVRHAAATARIPFFAIGGIAPGNAGIVVEAGAGRIAVVRAIRDADDPRSAAEALLAALRERAPVG